MWAEPLLNLGLTLAVLVVGYRVRHRPAWQAVAAILATAVVGAAVTLWVVYGGRQ